MKTYLGARYPADPVESWRFSAAFLATSVLAIAGLLIVSRLVQTRHGPDPSGHLSTRHATR
jgi:hypothetical protein